MHTCYSPVRRSPAKVSKLTPPLPLDLHVLSLSLAFILSQDQTLRCCILSFFFFSCFEYAAPRLAPRQLAPLSLDTAPFVRTPSLQNRFFLLRLLFQYDLSRVKLKLLTETSSRHCLCHLVSNLFLRTTFVLFARISMTFPLPFPRCSCPVVPESECKITPFSRTDKIFRNIFSDYFHTLRLNSPQISPLRLKKIFNKKAGPEEPA